MKKLLLIILFLSLPAHAEDLKTVQNIKTNIDSNFRYIPDGSKNSWKTPAQFIRDGGGDCEDFATYTKSQLDKLGYRSFIALGATVEGDHAILVVTINNEKYVIDNRYKEVLTQKDFLAKGDFLNIAQEFVSLTHQR